MVGVWIYKQRAKGEAKFTERVQKLTPIPSLSKAKRLDFLPIRTLCTCTFTAQETLRRRVAQVCSAVRCGPCRLDCINQNLGFCISALCISSGVSGLARNIAQRMPLGLQGNDFPRLRLAFPQRQDEIILERVPSQVGESPYCISLAGPSLEQGPNAHAGESLVHYDAFPPSATFAKHLHVRLLCS